MLEDIGLGSFNITPPGWGLVWLIIQLIFWLVVLCVMLYFLYTQFKYKYWVLIIEKYGDKDITFVFDEAKVIKGAKLWLKNERRTYPLIDFKFKRRCSGGGFLNSKFKKGVFILYKYGEYSLTPLDLKNLPEDSSEWGLADTLKTGRTYVDLSQSISKNLNLEPIDSDIKLFQNVFDDMLTKTEHKDRFNQIIPIIVTITCLTAVVGLGVVMMVMLKDNQASFEAVATSLRSTAEVLTDAITNFRYPAPAPGFGG